LSVAEIANNSEWYELGYDKKPVNDAEIINLFYLMFFFIKL